MSNPTDLPPGGWYPDAQNAGFDRYWDGTNWSDQVRASATPVAQATATATIPPVAPQPATGAARPIALALAALIVGIVALLFGLVPIFGALVGIAAVVLAVLALRKQQSKGMAVAGLVTGGIAVLASISVTAGLGAAVNSSSVKDPVSIVVEEPAKSPSPSPSPTETEAAVATPTAAPVEPAPPAPAAPEPEAAPSVPVEYGSALIKAISYSELMHMSKRGIYDQLTSEYGEQFSAEAAQYAVDTMTADWNKNALLKAREYQETMAMSPEAIRDQLASEYGEKFTPEEADYAVQNLNG
ncbi:Ltp family lipoprotein [Herbiconiux flava]|uniref:DUF2510 domain-containing protein n=1 Tax=Herbiconiux flava TaxID=881268 RepID=A0A852SR13_9MICO|nr:Ltp family lipoprotein [Herbiconiux flava]NYD71276.1 hypothetical protein [Herbiconiux flava]GLK18760.1 hypothetical protein GCM10017602_32420 [Herbiconiux flava]